MSEYFRVTGWQILGNTDDICEWLLDNKLTTVQRGAFINLLYSATQNRNILPSDNPYRGVTPPTFPLDLATLQGLGVIEPCDEGGRPTQGEIVPPGATSHVPGPPRVPVKQGGPPQEQIFLVWDAYCRASSLALGKRYLGVLTTPRKNLTKRAIVTHSFEEAKAAAVGVFLDAWCLEHNHSFEWAMRISPTTDNVEKFSLLVGD